METQMWEQQATGGNSQNEEKKKNYRGRHRSKKQIQMWKLYAQPHPSRWRKRRYLLFSETEGEMMRKKARGGEMTPIQQSIGAFFFENDKVGDAAAMCFLCDVDNHTGRIFGSWQQTLCQAAGWKKSG